MRHLLKRKSFLIFVLSLFLLACSNTEKSSDISPKTSLEQEQQKIQTKNEQAWEKAAAISFTDADFLKTKQPMSAEIIEPFDYQTGLVGDNAYNQKVYVYAIERLKKKSYIKDNQIHISVKSGAEINIAEDLFDYIVHVLFKEWNTALKEGRYKVVMEEKGRFYVEPIK